MAGSPVDVFKKRYTRSERAVLVSRIIECYREVNPEKVESGEVMQLCRKYAGQEYLLLRRVQHKYGLEVRVGRAWVLEGRTWVEATLRLVADGRLSWTELRRHRSDGDRESRSGSVDVRRCVVDPVESTTEPSNPSAKLVVTTAEGATVLAVGDEASRRGWIEDLKSTRAFFDKLAHEERSAAEARRDHALALEESVRTHRVEEDLRVRADEALRLDTQRAAALSTLTKAEAYRAEDDAACAPEILLSKLEAALDDALVHASTARDLDLTDDKRAAFYAFLDSVDAFLVAKATIDALDASKRPEQHVLTLIDDGLHECKTAATRILDRRNALRDVMNSLEAAPAVPVEVSKIIVYADDL